MYLSCCFFTSDSLISHICLGKPLSHVIFIQLVSQQGDAFNLVLGTTNNLAIVHMIKVKISLG